VKSKLLDRLAAPRGKTPKRPRETAEDIKANLRKLKRSRDRIWARGGV